jgi:dephospho-CoA kinase
MKEKVQAHAYRAHWAQEGLDWAARVRDAANGLLLDIDHVGSTNVEGLAAKDVIDIQALVYDLDEADGVLRALKAAGFRHQTHVRGDVPRPGYPDHPDCWDRMVCVEPDGERRVNLHLREFGTAGARVALLLRDFLRDDDLVRDQYGALKFDLARLVDDEEIYSAMKRPFVAVVLRLAEAWAQQTRWRPGAGDA